MSELLDLFERIDPARPAIRFEGATLDHGGFTHLVEAWARRLAGAGIAAGDRVALLSANRPDYPALVFACAKLGAILVPMNWRLAPAEHAFILEDSGAKLLLVEGDFAGPNAPRVSILDDEVLPEAAYARAAADDAAVLLVYTSGTTGRPKGAVLDQAALVANAKNSWAMHEMRADDRVLTVLPMFHVGGLNIQSLPALLLGAEVSLHRRFDPGATLDAIGREKPTLTLLVPATIQALREHPAWAATDLSCLRAVGTGSSIVPVDLIRAFHARGVPVLNVYGSTETAPIASFTTLADAVAKEGSVGRAAPLCEVRVVDGEIQVRGPNVAKRYWNADAAAFDGDWFKTGDIGHFDADGYLWVDERKNDMIISGGENIYPAEIEAVLDALPGIADSAVVARPDSKWGEVPVAFVVLKPGANFARPELDGRLARFKQPKDYFVVETLPRNAMGKLLRFELRVLARQRGEQAQ
ncbi:MAG: AMP-binding protein [Tagaea sp.]|nr:AMP-binding protein [Tagaea sp.]